MSARTGRRYKGRAPLFTLQALSLIQAGNLDEDLARLSDCDWVVEVVKEDLKVKQTLLAELGEILPPDLRQQVSAGAMTPDVAKQLAKARAQTGIAKSVPYRFERRAPLFGE